MTFYFRTVSILISWKVKRDDKWLILPKSTIYQPWILVPVARVRFQSSSRNKMPKCSYYISSHVAYHRARDMQETTSSPVQNTFTPAHWTQICQLCSACTVIKQLPPPPDGCEFDSKIGVTFTAREWLDVACICASVHDCQIPEIRWWTLACTTSCICEYSCVSKERWQDFLGHR